nr:peptidase domain-containing ABC transporter [Prevotella sp.]
MILSRFPIYLQHDSMECGIACLAMICKYMGREYSTEYLSRYCFATHEGVSLLGMTEAAKKLGLETMSARVTVETLGKAPMPCVLHWNQNHFVVLYKVKHGKFYVADPAKGLIKYSREEFEEHWLSVTTDDGVKKGIAMFVETTPVFYSHKAEEETGETRSFRFLFGYIRRYRKYFGQILMGLIVGSLLQLVLPFLTQAIVDVGIKTKDISFIWLILLGQLAITISRTLIDFFRRWILLRISMKINISLVSDFFIKLLRLPMSFFDTKLMGDLLQRMNDHARVEKFLTQQTLSVTFSMISFVILGAVLLVYNWLIFCVFLLGSIIYGVWIAMFLSRRKIIDYELFEQQSINNNLTYEFITSMQEIKLQDCEKRRREDWERTQTKLFGVQLKGLKLQQTQEAGSIFINEMKNIVIMVLSATAVINGNLTLGMMLSVQYIIGQLNSPVEQLMQFFYSLQDVKISLERINEIHRKKDENSGTDTQKSILNDERGINVEHVMFRYDRNSRRTTISDMSLSIPKGKVTAIVGASGSGKTTLIKLLLGYYPAEKGNIKIGDSNINELNLKWWRGQCGVVMQDGVIFSESIARNIAVGDGEIDHDRLRKAAEIANIKEYIEGLPLKYDTKIGRDGVGLSQGQRQRILIARAVYKNPQYIFLDEATNSLDAKNEREIVEKLETFYKGKTVI